MALLDNPKFHLMVRHTETGSDSSSFDEEEARESVRFFNMELLQQYAPQMTEEEKSSIRANMDAWGSVTDKYFDQWQAERSALNVEHNWLRDLWPQLSLTQSTQRGVEREFSPMLQQGGMTLQEDELPDALRTLLEKHKTDPFSVTKLDLVTAVNNYANEHFDYVDDITQYGKEVVMHPREVLATTTNGKFRDDCDGLASVKAGYLTAMGFTDKEVTLVAARDTGDDVGHYVVAVNLPTGPVVMNYDLEKPGEDFYAADEPQLVFHPSLNDMGNVRGRE